MKRLFGAVVSAALLIGLFACAPNEAVVDDPSSSGNASARPSHTADSSESPAEDSESPDPLASPPPEYDPSYRLDAAIPALINGLEMPVSGATGYTSVKLPLWPDIPTEVEEPEPSSSEPPAASDPPETSPPDETTEPVQSDPVEPAPEPEPPAETGEAVEPQPAPEETASESESEETPPSETLPPLENPDPTEDLRPTETPAPTPAPIETPTPMPTPEPTETPDPYKNAVAVWEPGTAFLILEENGDWWRVSRGKDTGWIEHRYCMINLPDVIPSMIYDDTNAYSSLFVSCGKNIPGITGKEIYNGNNTLAYNARLDRSEFIMPILYSAARNICAAQHKALAEGNCLVVYQTFRPYETQVAVAKAVSSLAKADPEVKAGISTPPWSIDWFIATGVSNHQRGYALDVSMVKVYETETKYIGSRPYLYMTDYEDYVMPTAMHELSIAAVSTDSPSSSKLSETMNEPAIALRGYFTSSGLSPLASEWWHFNDLGAMRATADKPSDGRYFLTECMSRLSW